MIIQGTRELLAEKAAWIVYKAVEVFLKTKNQAVIAVPGGGSVAEIFENLRKYKLPWARVQVFLLDEYLASAGPGENKYQRVMKHLGRERAPRMIHRLMIEEAELKASADRYYEELQRYGGRFDIVLASCGEDGRIASLFPNHPSVENPERGYIVISDAPKPPLVRISASYELIRKSDTGILLFFGKSKHNALQNFFNIHLTDVECPAKVMTKLNRYYLLTDLDIDIP